MSVLSGSKTRLITGCPSLGATFGFRNFSELFREFDTAYRSKCFFHQEFLVNLSKANFKSCSEISKTHFGSQDPKVQIRLMTF